MTFSTNPATSSPRTKSRFWNCDGTKVALAICEDLWGHDPAFGRQLYGRDPVARNTARATPDLIHFGFFEPLRHGQAPAPRAAPRGSGQEIQMSSCLREPRRAPRTRSFSTARRSRLDASGKLVGRLPVFKTAFGAGGIRPRKVSLKFPAASEREDEAPGGHRDFLSRPGGWDSRILQTHGIQDGDSGFFAAESTPRSSPCWPSRLSGPKNVLGVGMPSQYSSSHSLADAEELARNLGMPFRSASDQVPFLPGQS